MGSIARAFWIPGRFMLRVIKFKFEEVVGINTAMWPSHAIQLFDIVDRGERARHGWEKWKTV